MNTVTMHPTHLQNLVYQTQSESNDIINQAVKKITQIAINVFQKIESCILPALTKLTTQGIAQSIVSGAFGGAVTALLFFALGLPKENTGVAILAFCISDKLTNLYQESRDATAVASTQTTPLLSPESLPITTLEEKPV